MDIRTTTSRLADRIETDGRIDGIADRVSDAFSRLPIGGRVRSLLSGTWLGHPVHPFLVATPIGCWTSAGLLDLTGDRRSARTLVGAGVVSVLPTALTGLSDWADTEGAERRVGTVHLGANLLATALYAASWGLRRRHHGAGVAVSLAGATVATVGGWLGGHLAYAMGVGVDTNAFDGAPVDWTSVGGDVGPDSPARVAVGPTAVLVTEEAGALHAVADRCSHRGASLAEGPIEDGCVTCPWHGSRFDLATGEVRQGPAVVAQPVYDVRRTDDGHLEVRRDEPRALRSNATHP